MKAEREDKAQGPISERQDNARRAAAETAEEPADSTSLSLTPLKILGITHVTFST